MQEEKKLLASLCMQWIHEKSSIFLDCSTTALHIAKQLADFPGKLTVMTNSLAVAKEIDANPQIRLILFGGELNRDREAFEGQTVLEQMKTCFINYAFVSSAGCSLEAGITDSTREEADIRRQVLKQAKHKILVVDNTKIGRNEVYVTRRCWSSSVRCCGSFHPKNQPSYGNGPGTSDPCPGRESGKKIKNQRR